MYQIDTYLTLTGLDWGILSNGRTWRLIHKSSSRTLETTFEIDLLAALEQPDGTFAANEADLLYWKRRVVEACIYGVDKNPMAVELAKLSLWLKTAAADKPLSFLDHHLQRGDSLIVAWLKDLQRAPTTSSQPPAASHQQPLLDESAFTRDINRAVADVMTIERLPTNDIEDVHAKEATWQAVRQRYTDRWRRLADLWVSAWFGNAMTPQEYRALAAHLAAHFPGNSEFPGKSLLSDAQAETFLNHPAVTDNDYFHWELAFPEVFFDEYGRSLDDAAGFDAVIGNPPWVNVGRESGNENVVSFFKNIFTSIAAGCNPASETENTLKRVRVVSGQHFSAL